MPAMDSTIPIQPFFPIVTRVAAQLGFNQQARNQMGISKRYAAGAQQFFAEI
jgi:hypothetical protein